MTPNLLIVVLLSSFLIISYCTIIITQPQKTPFVNNTIEYAYANFGQINYGKVATYDLVNIEENLCQSSQLPMFNTSTYILADDSGSCSYTQKARTAQALGAKGLIIASQIYNYHDKIVPSSDINGRKVHIAVLFISKSTYKHILFMKDIQIKVNFTMVQKQKSQIIFYLQAASRQTYVFLREFKPYYDKIKNSLKTQLIYFTTACPFCDPNDCIIGQKYCAFDLQYYNLGVGSHIVKEQLRQYNIFLKYGADKWFEYMNLFDRNCDFDWKYVAQCSQTVQNQIGLDQDLIAVQNMQYVMKNWKEKQTKYSFITPPQVAINGILFPGNLQGSNVYEALCSSLTFGCSSSSQPSQQQSGLSFIFIILGIFTGALIVLIVGSCVYRKVIGRQLTNDVSSNVKDIVAKYASKVKQLKNKRKSRMMQKLNEQI